MSRMKFPLAVLILLSLAACITPKQVPAQDVPVEARDGVLPLAADCNRTVPIFAADEDEARVREKAWIARNYPGARIMDYDTARCGEARVAVITLATTAGATRKVLFDISSLDRPQAAGEARMIRPGSSE